MSATATMAPASAPAKSTLVEASAEGFGLGPYDGSHDGRYAAPGRGRRAFRGKFLHAGLYVLDEPEAALPFSSCIDLIRYIGWLAYPRSHVGVAASHAEHHPRQTVGLAVQRMPHRRRLRCCLT